MHLNVVQSRRAESNTEGLPGGFFGREASGEALGSLRALGLLTLAKKPRNEPRATLQDNSEALHVYEVEADADRSHSTVTVLARLRGRSTLRPLARAK